MLQGIPQPLLLSALLLVLLGDIGPHEKHNVVGPVIIYILKPLAEIPLPGVRHPVGDRVLPFLVQHGQHMIHLHFFSDPLPVLLDHIGINEKADHPAVAAG